MPPQEQADLWMSLRDRMKVDWNEMTLAEKKAGMSLLFVFTLRLDWSGGRCNTGHAGEKPIGKARDPYEHLSSVLCAIGSQRFC